MSQKIFDEFFAPRYQTIFDAIHACGWHVILHSCGRINAFVPTFIELGVDVLNMQQSRNYGLVEFGEQFRGKVCFLATVDIQSTLPRGDRGRRSARRPGCWSATGARPAGGMIAFDYGDWEAVGRPAGSPADHVRRVRPAAAGSGRRPWAAIRPFRAKDRHKNCRCCQTGAKEWRAEE